MRSIHRAHGARSCCLAVVVAACAAEGTPPAEPIDQVAQAVATTAVYDSGRRAPACASPSSSCDSGTLLRGRAGLGPELNAPNTLNASCADGTAGSWHVDESLDRLVISSLDGTALASGTTARIDATVWSYSAASDRLDLYSATDVSNPSWVLVATLSPTVSGGLQTLSTTYTLPASSLQAVRGQLRYLGAASPCTVGSFNERDDLVFAAAAGDSPPSSAITAPAPGITVTGPISITATASDDVGVTQVQFFRDGMVLLGAATAPPYTATWDPAGAVPGQHELTSKAFDTRGQATVSAPVSVFVPLPPTPPQVALSSPADQQVVARMVTLSADVLAGTYALAAVEFSVDGVVVSTDTTAPYQILWDSTAVVNSGHTFSARACDVTGTCRTSTITAYVDNDLVPPTTALTSPADGAVVSGTLLVTATAADNRAVLWVEFYLDDVVLIGRITPGPYAMTWNSGSVPDGPHTLTSKAYDTRQNTAVSTIAISVVNLDTTPPTAALVAPVAGSTISGATLLRASATDDLAVARVEFYLDDTILVGTATTAPYYVAWDSASVANGPHVFSCRAYDGAGNPGSSAPVAVAVYTDVTAPTTTLTSPAPGSSVAGTLQLTATADDDLAVTRVEFYLDGTSLIGSAQAPPYAASWRADAVANGAHQLTSKAYDAAGHSATSAPVSVTVANQPPPALMAAVDLATQVPRCLPLGKSCDTGALIDGAGGSEPGTPNTYNRACLDGNSGFYHIDESLDRLKVSTLDNSALAAGKTVRLDATVWAGSAFASDQLDLYFLVSAPSLQWVYLTTLTPSKAGAQTFALTYVLPAGTEQAVRGQFRRGSGAGPCAAGPYNDRDDLRFTAQP
jgi:large repetitive protein